MKKLLFGCIASGLLLTAAPAGAIPPPGETVYVSAGSGSCSVDGVKVVLQQDVIWRRYFTTSGTHKVQQKQGFWSFNVGGGEVEKTMQSAGTFQQRCDSSAYSLDQAIRVPPKAGRLSGNTFRITWATSKAPGTQRYSVRYRIGSGSYRAWKSGTSSRSATFAAKDGKTYFFQAKSIRSGKATDWSPDKKFTA